MGECFEDQRPPYLLSTDRTLLDYDAIHAYWAKSYWSPGIARSRVVRGIEEPGQEVGVLDVGAGDAEGIEEVEPAEAIFQREQLIVLRDERFQRRKLCR